MFEGYAADLLATSLGRFVDVQKDKLRISLWSGECLRGLGSCYMFLTDIRRKLSYLESKRGAARRRVGGVATPPQHHPPPGVRPPAKTRPFAVLSRAAAWLHATHVTGHLLLWVCSGMALAAT